MIKTYEFAGVKVKVQFHYGYIEKQCKEYECDGEPLFSVEITNEDLEYEKKATIEENGEDAVTYPAYLESIAFYRKFVSKAIQENIVLFHGSAISYEGKAYLFTAPSGTGKSTHSAICKKVFGDKVGYVNDDKPLFKLVDGVWYVYGTPWDGKHKRSQKICVPLGGICVLKRGEKNEIKRLTAQEGVYPLFAQSFRPTDQKSTVKYLELMDNLCKTPIWELHCNMKDESAKTSLPTMSKMYKD